MMKEIALLFFYIFSALLSHAQERWNDTLSLGYQNTRIIDMVLRGDTITVYGTGVDTFYEQLGGQVAVSIFKMYSFCKNLVGKTLSLPLED